MKNSKLIQILKTFSKEEIKDFDRFVRSPYFNSSEPTIKFFTEIKKHYPSFDSSKFTKDSLFKKVYGEQKYKDDIFRKLVSNLHKLSKQFMIQIQFTEREVENSRLLREQLLERRLNDMFEAENNRIVEYMKARPIYHKYFLEFAENDILLGGHLNQTGDVNASEKKVLESIKHSTLFYFILCWHFTSFLRSRRLLNKNINSDPIWKLMDTILTNKEICQNVLNVLPEYKELTEVYFCEYELSKNPTLKNYLNFKGLVYKYLPVFGTQQNISFFRHLYNFIKYINHSSFNKVEERLEIQEMELRYNLLIIPKAKLTGAKLMSAVTFISFLKQYLVLKKFKRCEEFINQYHKYIAFTDRNNAYNYALALLAFHKKDFGKSLILAAKVEQKKPHFLYGVRVLILLNYLETNDYEGAFYLLEAFKRFLDKNKKVSEKYKSGYYNFIKYYKPIITFHSGGNQKPFKTIYENLKKENDLNVPYYDYLKVKFQKLLK